MKKFLISGGNSGIGLEAGRQLAAQGHHVVLLGRDAAKGQAAAASIGASGKAEFMAADLSTHEGVRVAARAILAAHPRLDGALMAAGVLMTRDERTADDLHPVFAVNYLSRYHLGNLLLPALKGPPPGKLVLLVPGIPLDSKVDFNLFPRFKPFPGMGALSGLQIANFHYVDHLARTEPGVVAGLTNVGLVNTGIMREMPAAMRVMFKLMGPLFTIPVSRAAANAVHALTSDGWKSGSYWAKPGKSDQVTPLALDAAVTARVVEASRGLTGA